MAYTHADGRIIFKMWGRMRCLAASTIEAGRLVYLAGSTGILQAIQTTSASATTTKADFVTCEKISSGKWGWCALAVEIKDPPTIGAGGAVTKGSLATTADIGAAMYLSATAGYAYTAAPTATATVIKQEVGFILDTDRILLQPRAIQLSKSDTIK